MSLCLKVVNDFLHVTMLDMATLIFDAKVCPSSAFTPPDIVDSEANDDNCILMICFQDFLVCWAEMVGWVEFKQDVFWFKSMSLSQLLQFSANSLLDSIPIAATTRIGILQ